MSNKNMPRTFGDSIIHSSHFDILVEDHEHQLHERHLGTTNDQERKIGKIIADNLVDNGATLQMGKKNPKLHFKQPSPCPLSLAPQSYRLGSLPFPCRR